MAQRLHRLHRRIRGSGGNRQRHLERVLRTAQARSSDRTTHEDRRRFRPALAPSCLTYSYACARIDDCATLRRRSAIVAVQRTGNNTRTWKSVTHVPRRFYYLSPRPVIRSIAKCCAEFAVRQPCWRNEEHDVCDTYDKQRKCNPYFHFRYVSSNEH